LLKNITAARIFRLRQSEEKKNSAQPQNWLSMRRNVSLGKSGKREEEEEK
jgi:hypothetical protein